MAARNLREAIDRAKQQRQENTIKIMQEIREWIGEELINKCYPPRVHLGASGSCAVFFDTRTLTEAERSALKNKILLHFHARSEESMVKKVEIRQLIITFHMISQVVNLFV